MNSTLGTLLTLSISLLAATPLLAVAAPASSASSSSTARSIREEAVRENSTINEKTYRKTIRASEAQDANVESFLKLEDPSLELRNRAWLWTFEFKVQTFAPIGTARVATSRFDLSGYGESLLPSIELGAMIEVMDRPSVRWSSGLAAYAGIASQTTALRSSTGFVYQDARLNTTVLSGVWNNRLSSPKAPNWTALVNPEIGAINYTQTAPNSSFANFSQQNGFWGLGLGVEYAVNEKWGIVGEYRRRTANAENIAQTNIPTNNFEIGTSVVW